MSGSRLTAGLSFVGLGTLLLLDAAGMVGAWTLLADSGRLLWPLALIVVGAWLIARRPKARPAPVVTDGAPSAVLADRHLQAAPGPLTIQSVSTVLGDLDLDLTPATLTGRHTLQATTVLGDLDLTVPEGWLVTVSGPQVLADVAVAPAVALPPGAPELVLQLTTVLGDVDVHRRAVAGRSEAPWEAGATPAV